MPNSKFEFSRLRSTECSYQKTFSMIRSNLTKDALKHFNVGQMIFLMGQYDLPENKWNLGPIFADGSTKTHALLFMSQNKKHGKTVLKCDHYGISMYASAKCTLFCAESCYTVMTSRRVHHQPKYPDPPK